MEEALRDAACDRAYRDYADDIYRVAYGILRNPDEALDATHDAFARAWERWEQYDSQRPLRPWLHGIVVHVALDQLRRRRVRIRASVVDTEPADRARDRGDPQADIVLRRVVDQAMSHLKPDARAALVLRHYYGYEYAQIGEMLGVPSGTVGSLISRAHSALRTRLTDFAPASNPPISRTGLPGAPANQRREPAIDPPEAVQ